ncbi:histidine kinase N-terminal domain-containing protein [Bacillus anthracis]|uniref:histidine kinase N-terminal domain-containing protein n=1 Tax=Bacillus anthracis TaxID=1392 RepID=UPI003904BB86
MEEIKCLLCRYLKERQEKFISDWKKKVIIREREPYKEEIIKNGEHLLSAFIMYLKEEISLQEIEITSKKIARERIDAKVNIAEFIHNTNVAKIEIMNILTLLNPDLQQYQALVKKINQFFDHLIYYTVHSYYEQKA